MPAASGLLLADCAPAAAPAAAAAAGLVNIVQQHGEYAEIVAALRSKASCICGACSLMAGQVLTVPLLRCQPTPGPREPEFSAWRPLQLLHDLLLGSWVRLYTHATHLHSIAFRGTSEFL